MGKLVKIGAIAVILAAIAIAAFFMIFGQAAEPGLELLNPDAIKENGVEYENIEKNTVLYEALAEAGIENALVDVTKERIIVRLEIPEGYGKQATLSYVFGAAAETGQSSGQLIVEVFEGETPKEQYTASIKDIIDAAEGKITEESFAAKVERKEL